MKIITTDNRVLMAILVIASIGGTLAVVQGFDLVNYNSQTPLSTGGAMLTGNVKVIQYDENGQIIAYRQTGNHIVKEGMEVIMAQVFGGMNSTISPPLGPGYSFVSGLTHPIRFMQIGTGGEWRLLHNDTNIAYTIGTCLRQPATIVNSTLQGGAHKYPNACTDAIGNLCSAQMNVTATANFLGSAGCAVNSIDEAGIYDNSTNAVLGQRNVTGPSLNDGYMFARNNFGSVNLGPLDTLQLQWEFTFTDS
ncbi:MAG: hypothetical protein ACRENZ_09350 [Thermodesulfobacteriota bacterium]